MSKPLLKSFIEENYTVFKYYLQKRYKELNSYDAEDIVQQTVIKLLYKGHDELSIRNVSSYIYTALQNSAKDYFKKNSRLVLRSIEMEIPTQTLEDEVLASELSDFIDTAIASLDDKSRYVFVETEIKGRPYEELVEETGEKIGTLLSRKSRARKKLRVLIKEYMEVNNG